MGEIGEQICAHVVHDSVCVGLGGSMQGAGKGLGPGRAHGEGGGTTRAVSLAGAAKLSLRR
ncbi:hypothetical protein HYDPIDRAFT_118428 [Hydnomerulius pinastri MD-312]|uniref:Uncharacterized protein n=1 Tax=Hydnomerulius pinastri MD-312 TaxID=994086 RepID=A0A0C9W8T0_9AGAM|nr:hypothetical protein HYDPIDRAFT_118888 [Hydnomerulius pinastri MD-312]KIJ59516.1 hypothetical protein HYDPIDRAFT_118428 [Hydnomerulius pinastri MD-312]